MTPSKTNEIRALGAVLVNHPGAVSLLLDLYSRGYHTMSPKLNEVYKYVINNLKDKKFPPFARDEIIKATNVDPAILDLLLKEGDIDSSQAVKSLIEDTQTEYVETVVGKYMEKAIGRQMTKEDTENIRREIMQNPAQNLTKTLDDHLNDIVVSYMDHKDGKIKVTKTGINTLDAHINGLAPEDIVVIGGYSGTGKTNIAVQIISHVLKQKVPVYFSSAEMSVTEMIYRFASHRIKQYEKFINDTEAHDEIAAQFVDAASQFVKENKDYITIQQDNDFDSVMNNIVFRARNGQCKIAVIDFIQNLTITDQQIGRLPEYRQIGYMCDKIREVAKSEKITIIVMSQTTSRSADTFKGAGKIMDMASIAIIIRKALKKDDTGSSLQRFKYRLEITKARKASPGVIPGYIIAPDPAFQEAESNDINLLLESDWEDKNFMKDRNGY